MGSIRMTQPDKPETDIIFHLEKEQDPQIAFRFEGLTQIYGFGAANDDFAKRESEFKILNLDTFFYSIPGSSYSSFPMFITRAGSLFRAFILNTSFPVEVKISRNQRGERQVLMTMQSEGIANWPLDLYVLEGSPATLSSAISDIFGRPSMPPLWSLGFHQCRWSYKTQKKVLAIAERMRSELIPCDAIWLDIHYMQNYKVFTWNRKSFPDPRAMNRKLKSEGFYTVAIVDPGVKKEPGYEVYESGLISSAYCTSSDEQPYTGKAWPGSVVFPDFDREEVRHWWAEHSIPLLADGVQGFWNDMNDPVLKIGKNYDPLQEDIIHANGTHRRLRNLYANDMARSSFEAQQMFRPEERPFVLTRSASCGIQKYAAVWTGDNHSSWEHLRQNLTMVLNLGLCGVPFSGSDIGGFASGPGLLGVIKLRRNRELMARWLQLGSLMPFCRMHTALYSVSQEPWSYGKKLTDIARATLRRRYMLMPYIYNQMRIAHLTGAPIVRPVWWEDHEYPGVGEDLFLLGSDILVAPVLKKGETSREILLPQGDWYNFYDGQKYSGRKNIKVKAALDHIPIFVRAGAVLPLANPHRNTEDTMNSGLYLAVYPAEIHSNEEVKGEVFIDDGKTAHDMKTSGHLIKVEIKKANRNLKLKLSMNKKATAPYKTISVLLPESVTEIIAPAKLKSSVFSIPDDKCNISWRRVEIPWQTKEITWKYNP